MGSFNLSCFASHQTIVAGAKCRIAPIVKQLSYQSTTVKTRDGQSLEVWGDGRCAGSSGRWSPIAPFIEAEYEDMGVSTLIFNKSTRISVVALFQYLVQHSLDGEFSIKKILSEVDATLAKYILDSSYQVEYESDKFDEDLAKIWAQVEEAISESIVFIVEYAGEPVVPMSLSYMHEEMFKALYVRMESYVRPYGDRLNEFQIDSFYARLMKGAKDKLETTRAKQLEEGIAPPSDTYNDMFFLWNIIHSQVRLGASDGEGFLALHDLTEFQAVYQTTGYDSPEMFKILFPLIEQFYVYRSLNHLQIAFAPFKTAGQDSNNDIGKEYIKLISKVADKIDVEINQLRNGPFFKYSATVPDDAAFTSFIEKVKQSSDIYFIVTKFEKRDYHNCLVQFELNIYPEEVPEVLSDSLEGIEFSEAERTAWTELIQTIKSV